MPAGAGAGADSVGAPQCDRPSLPHAFRGGFAGAGKCAAAGFRHVAPSVHLVLLRGAVSAVGLDTFRAAWEDGARVVRCDASELRDLPSGAATRDLLAAAGAAGVTAGEVFAIAPSTPPAPPPDGACVVPHPLTAAASAAAVRSGIAMARCMPKSP
jgi:hypothetical protein